MDRETFIGWKRWRMLPSTILSAPEEAPPWDSPPLPGPTLMADGLTARIHWRPVAKAAWELVKGDYGLCSLPGFDLAEQAKADAWEHMGDLP